MKIWARHLLSSCQELSFPTEVFGVSFLTDSMRTPLYTELRMYCWHWAIAKQSTWKRNHPWPPAPSWSLSTENSPVGGQKEWRRKQAGKQFRGHFLEGGGSRVLFLFQGCFDHLKCHFHYFHSHEAFKIYKNGFMTVWTASLILIFSCSTPFCIQVLYIHICYAIFFFNHNSALLKSL